MEPRSAGSSPAVLPIRTVWLLVGFAVLLVGYVLTTAGAGIITAEPVVPAPPPGPQQPGPTTGTETPEQGTTTDNTSETPETETPETGTTGDTAETPAPDTPDTTGAGPGGGTDGETGTEGWAPPAERVPPYRPAAQSGTQINTSGAVPMWIGLGTQLIGMVTAGLSCLAAWAKVKPSRAEGQTRNRIDRRRRS